MTFVNKIPSKLNEVALNLVRSVLLALCLVLVCSITWAQDELVIMYALRMHIGDPFEVRSQQSADFDADGRADWVGVLKIHRSDGPMTAIYVVHREKTATRIRGKSKEVSFMDCAGTCGVEIEDVKKNSFFVRQKNFGGWGHASRMTQFSYRRYHWLGIAQQSSSIEFGSDKETMEDINLLTGAYTLHTIHWPMSGEPKPPVIKKGVRKNKAPIALEKFDPISF